MSKTGEIIGSLAANFIVAGIVAKLKSGDAAAISFGIGLVLLAVYFLFFRKKSDSAQQPITIQNNPNISPNISPSFNPTFNPTIHIGFSDQKAQEEDRQESLAVDFMKKSHPDFSYDLTEIADGTGLTSTQVWDTLNRLAIRGIVWPAHSHDGDAWFLNQKIK
jgi:hypothetical protein